MSRAQTRSSSRMSNLSRASNVSTATGSSRLRGLLDDYDIRATTPIRVRTTNLLIPRRENPEYESLRKEIHRSRYRSKTDKAAVLIQKTFRMHQVKKKLRGIVQASKKNRYKKGRMFLYLMIINSTSPKFDRRSIYESVISASYYLPKFFRNYRPASNEVFAATGMMAIPPYTDGQTLVRFVHTFYRSRLKLILEEWHVAACKGRQEAKYCKHFRLDQMSMLKYGIFYRTFIIWANFTRVKRNRKLSTIDIPQWNIFMKGRLRKQRLAEKAIDFRKKTICENAVQALRNLVLHRRHYKRFYEQTVQYHIKKSMKFALSAWIKYLVIQQNKSITMRFVFRRWLQSVQRRKHLIMLSDVLTKRYEYYQKRLIFDIFSKNKKVSQCLNMYQYLRIMQKPSLALYFVSILRKDQYSEAISHTFSAWIDLVRRRRRWLHFVFMNEVTSEYTPKKRLFLAALRHYALPTLTPICLYNDKFKKESMYMYHNVMNEKIDPSSIYLIVNGNTPEEVKKAASQTKTKIQQREVFFKIWESQKKSDFSLFMRSVIVYCAKKASVTMRDSESVPDLRYKQYKKVISYLAGMNLASDQKFRVALQTVKENNKKNLLNRMSCLHRDNLIILAHDSHSDAIDLHDANYDFKNSDELVKTKKIVEASENLAKNFQPLITIDKLGAVLEQPNEDQFVFVDGCKSAFKSFKPTIIECHNIIHRELVRSEIGHDVASRFDKLLAGHDLSSSAKNGAHSNSRVDPFSRYKSDKPPPKSRPTTAINEKLSSKFPQRNRKARIIGKETEKFKLSDAPIPDVSEDEQEEEEEKADEIQSGRVEKNDSFNDKTKSVASILLKNEKSLLSSIMGKSHEKVANNIEKEEEDNTEIFDDFRDDDENSDSDVKFEIDQTLIDGFDKTTMMSLKQSKDVQSPRTAKKYKLFLEILFGRAGKEVNNSQINRLRQKIISEYRNKKPSLASCGINTRTIERPVSGILVEYRKKDDDKEIPSLKDNKNKKADINQANSEVHPNEYYQTYNSRRYYIKKKTTNKNEDNDNEEGNNDAKTERNETDGQHSKFSDNEDNKGSSANSSDSEFREDLDNDDHRELQKTMDEIIDENNINKDKEDDQFEDTEFDPAVHKNVEEEEEDVINENENENDAHPSQRKPKLSSRKISSITPFTSRNKDGESAMSKVDKIAIRLLNDQIPDEHGYGLLVDIDPDQMPPLLFIGQNGNEVPEKEEAPGYSPEYKDRKRIKVQSRLHKRMVPIVIPNKKEITNNMKLAYHESDNFDKLLLVNGKSQYIRAEKKETKKFAPHYNRVIFGDSSTDFEHFDKGPFVEDQVVSFQSGKRQVGTNTQNFMALRIKTGKQRGITKPFLLLDTTPSTITNLSKTLKDARPTTSVVKTEKSSSSTSSRSKTQLDIRAIGSHIKEITNKIVQSLASSEDSEMFDTFYQRAKSTLKPKPQSILNYKSIETSHQIYELLIEINYDYNKNDNFVFAANNLLALAAKYDVYPPVLVESIENSLQTAHRSDESGQKKVKKPKIITSYTSDDLNASWITDVPLDYNYNAVALQYKENKMKNNVVIQDENLQAIIASTNPTKPTSKRRKRMQIQPDKKWDDVLKDYDVNDMMLVTPLDVSDAIVDDVIREYNKFLKTH